MRKSETGSGGKWSVAGPTGMDGQVWESVTRVFPIVGTARRWRRCGPPPFSPRRRLNVSTMGNLIVLFYVRSVYERYGVT